MKKIQCGTSFLNVVLCRTEEKEIDDAALPPPQQDSNLEESSVSQAKKKHKKKKKKKHKHKHKHRESHESGSEISAAGTETSFGTASISDHGSNISAIPIDTESIHLPTVAEDEDNTHKDMMDQKMFDMKNERIVGVGSQAAASSMPLDEFIKKLKGESYKVKKHGRAGKSRDRLLRLSENEEMLSWRPIKKGVYSKASRYQKEISKITEVRAATEIDKQNPRYLGTSVLRRSCEPNDAGKALSILWPERSLDLEFETEAECVEFMNGMKQLLHL